MIEILACIDGSSFTESVCDHAAWLASRTGGRVRVLHAVMEEGPSIFGRPEALIRHAVQRLQNEGVGDVVAQQAKGALVESVLAAHADLIVMGKRGLTAETDRRALGRHVDPIVRLTAAPVCLAPQLFMPIYRALVVLDADITHRTAVEFVASQPDLSDIDCDLIVMARPGENADEKVAWAREVLSAISVEVIPIAATGLDDAVARYMESRRTDVVVISRQVLLPNQQSRLVRTERGGLWSWRTPVLVF
jgi:nucleotide-binding universal stress UspA family protein